MTTNNTKLKEIAREAIDKSLTDLHKLSQDIWNNPELAFKEYFAHERLATFLETLNFTVQRKFKLETAFKACYGKESSPGPHIAVLCEYDALPGIGHACGHNLIAEVGVGAALGIQAAMKADDQPMGTLTVLGTPAEEGMCGKADLIQLGAFEGLDVAMMAHPSQVTLSKPRYVSMTPVNIIYKGKASHASSYPWEGVNALDAAVMCYNNISCLRQQMKPDWRVHGVIKNGGQQANIIPEETELEYYIRTPNDTDMIVLKKKISDCIEAAAMATGCMVDYKFGSKSYSYLLSNQTLATLFEHNAELVGVEFETDEEKRQKFGGSTDMGNVSQILPSIHPKFYIGTSFSQHTKEFAVAAGDPMAQPYTLAVAKALAMTAIDLYTDPSILEKVRRDFEEDIQRKHSA
ncbi:hypothetical protein CHS0354_018829 [Potamilus streckersoni]|uniref:Peptidase M20 domain-containing protein 2 n=1 Tax=Potamilus streckersoni TaxID=2493646 RepID=A0AAE0VUH5_9BIVA|nr:hypothetical protein CHS0354_018829 [Potamilus streckersoni]